MNTQTMVLARPAPTVADLVAPLLTDELLTLWADGVAQRTQACGPAWVMAPGRLRGVVLAALRHVAAPVVSTATDGAAEADGADDLDEAEGDGQQDSTLLNWLEAQGFMVLQEDIVVDGHRIYELTDMAGDVVGTGPDLRTAIRDAMGVPR